ncbi:leucine aminopeptidase [Stereum hirsutum FP-91666 SS1]|uniref:leucine aminopeptidase n=1 Tax=Stereum hirsutum (strain FP-91666) TaxID=721885 RepID=UPI000444A106|nr:leucine aminopeptidase [Stereum hirsutum FP-91666 SS1]EIM81157.1 leucine aminopeptidase [Stereum hirsutum FP-91666 SS1]
MSSIYILPISPNAPSSGTNSNSSPAVPNAIDPHQLWSTVPAPHSSKPAKLGTTRVFYAPSAGGGEGGVSAVVSLGSQFGKKKGDERREVVRRAVGSGVKTVKGLWEGEKVVKVDAREDAHAAAVAAYLAEYKFDLKTDPPSRFRPGSKIDKDITFEPLEKSKEWDRGVVYAEAQNLARTLMELPANMLTPTAFAERMKAEFANVADTEVIVRDEEWAAEKGMNTFLSVTKGTDEPAKFLEIHYNGAAKGDQPLAFVGKGITFDSGGISIKPSADMKLMRGDMGGAATVVAAALAIAKLKFPINLVCITPLCENMPGPKANKPGDIIYAMNGKSVEIDNTDAEGRLILSDALYYTSTTYKPHTLIDVATLTGAMDIALGEVFAGVFSTSDSLWSELHEAGETEYDRFWRMPLDDEFAPQIHRSNADLCNTGGKPGGSCTAALFLKPFVEGIEPKEGEEGSEEEELRWAHIDIAGVMEATRPSPYMEMGMTGRPVRALVEFVRRMGQE